MRSGCAERAKVSVPRRAILYLGCGESSATLNLGLPAITVTPVPPMGTVAVADLD
jgi:hypothetical protein